MNLQLGSSSASLACSRSHSASYNLPKPQNCSRFASRQATRCLPNFSERFGNSRCRRGLRCQAESVAAEAEAEAPSTSNNAEQPEETDLNSILKHVETDLENGNFDLQRLGSEIQELLDKGLQSSKTEAQNKYLRLSADFDNFRKRSASERERQADQIRGDVIKQLIPLVDSFEAAQASIKPETEAEKQTSSAYLGLYKQMVETFKGLGVEAVPGAGQPFDPEFHDAILREENDDVPNGTVLQELRRGFRLGKTLLRPSMVKVSFSEEKAADSSEAEV